MRSVSLCPSHLHGEHVTYLELLGAGKVGQAHDDIVLSQYSAPAATIRQRRACKDLASNLEVLTVDGVDGNGASNALSFVRRTRNDGGVERRFAVEVLSQWSRQAERREVGSALLQQRRKRRRETCTVSLAQ